MSGLGYRAIHAETRKFEKQKKQASPKIGAPRLGALLPVSLMARNFPKYVKGVRRRGGLRMRGPPT